MAPLTSGARPHNDRAVRPPEERHHQRRRPPTEQETEVDVSRYSLTDIKPGEAAALMLHPLLANALEPEPGKIGIADLASVLRKVSGGQEATPSEKENVLAHAGSIVNNLRRNVVTAAPGVETEAAVSIDYRVDELLREIGRYAPALGRLEA